MKSYRTLHFRLKDKHALALLDLARQVNLVWNYCNELSQRAITERYHWLSAYEMQKYTTGLCDCEGITLSATTIQQICAEYVTRRNQFKKKKLRWRCSDRKSSVYSLGWIPFKKGGVRYKDGQIHMKDYHFSFWDSYGLSNYALCAGSFSEDARGRWYFNVQVEVEVPASAGTQVLGIDLGLKTAAVCSDGDQLVPRWYRKNEEKLAKAQRKKKKHRARAIHAKIANTRMDDMHKFSTCKVYDSCEIYVGDVSTKKLAKTSMAKSVYDAGWGMLKRMLEYKCKNAGVRFKIIDESYTTQTCSVCGTIPTSSPKGRAGLKIRRWTCCDCGAVHDRDINAARNIAKRGHALPGL